MAITLLLAGLASMGYALGWHSSGNAAPRRTRLRDEAMRSFGDEGTALSDVIQRPSASNAKAVARAAMHGAREAMGKVASKAATRVAHARANKRMRIAGSDLDGQDEVADDLERSDSDGVDDETAVRAPPIQQATSSQAASTPSVHAPDDVAASSAAPLEGAHKILTGATEASDKGESTTPMATAAKTPKTPKQPSARLAILEDGEVEVHEDETLPGNTLVRFANEMAKKRKTLGDDEDASSSIATYQV